MTKKYNLTVAFAAVIGIILAFLRHLECQTVFGAFGLVDVSSPLTAIIIALSVISCAAFAIFSAIARNGETIANLSFEKVVPKTTVVEKALFIFLGAFIAACSFLYFRSNGGTIITMLFALFMFLTGVCVVVLPLNLYGGGAKLLTFIPPVAGCLWLIVYYTIYAGNPTLLAYCYQCLAIACMTLAYFFLAGFSYNKGNWRYCMFFSLSAIVFCFTCIGENIGMYRLLLAANGLVLAVWCRRIANAPYLEAEEAETIEEETEAPEK